MPRPAIKLEAALYKEILQINRFHSDNNWTYADENVYLTWLKFNLTYDTQICLCLNL